MLFINLGLILMNQRINHNNKAINFKMINIWMRMLYWLKRYNRKKRNNTRYIFKKKLKKLMNKSGIRILIKIKIMVFLFKMREKKWIE